MSGFNPVTDVYRREKCLTDFCNLLLSHIQTDRLIHIHATIHKKVRRLLLDMVYRRLQGDSVKFQRYQHIFLLWLCRNIGR